MLKFRRLALAILLLVICSSIPAWSVTYRVDDVVVRGNRRVELDSILPLLTVKPGTTVMTEQIDADIRAIYGLGRFEDISAEIIEENGAKILIYNLKERPLVRKIIFEGNDEFDESKLQTLITLRTPDIYEPRVVEESVRAIRDEYVKEGYYGVEVKPEVKVNDRAEAEVTFRIREGEKVLVDHIVFDGNTVISDRKLKKVMQTKERWFLSWLTGRGTFLEDVLKNDLLLIADEYLNQGYLQVKVKDPVILISEDRKSLDIYIEIEEGDQFRIGKIDVDGDLLLPREELLAKITLKPGDVFSRRQLRENVIRLSDLYADRGYAFVNVAPLSHLDTEKRQIDLKFDIEKGDKVHIHRIKISGNTKTRDKVIRREIKLAEGDLFSASKIKASRRNINNLGFFEEVELNTRKISEKGLMDIDVQVKERPTGTFSVGAGYSSVDGLVAQGSVSQSNFLGLGLKLDVSGSFGGKSTTYNLGLLDPHFLDTRFALGGDLYKTDREYTDYDKATVGGDVKLGFSIAEDNRFFFVYRYEEKEITNVDPTAAIEILEAAGVSTLSALTASFTRDRTDYRPDPTRGYIGEISAEYAGLGGTEKYAKLILDYRHYIPAIWKTYFMLHGQIGHAFKVSGDPIPLDEKFRLGGISTLRGFDSREVGPRVQQVDEFGVPIPGAYDYPGGNKEAFANIEYLFPLFPEVKMKGVVFFDVGNAWASGENYFDDVRYSAGAGIRWMSPLGPLRLEWGRNLDPRDGEETSRFDFSMGRFY
ncbi:Beta-barrel assembly machine subunit BamA [Geothermobacter ehrlichii]|uniref:Outer membrane protein assembly factor BamA n=1 Tax=Geothermobacter ehrlichii TaxID=213224 RepID=A0A5D3WPA3_9BACT|nr:outer membrane protein assembly factor BamA [Geothermobacter ehrlichii]TYP00037.1 Beta-barrel assembly machine subunit BamA [Geothermobacter ehrlichii]